MAVRFTPSNRTRRVRTPFRGDLFPVFVVGMIVVGLIISGVTFFNFKNQCENQGGDIAILWSGDGGFKCNSPEGRLLDVY